MQVTNTEQLIALMPARDSGPLFLQEMHESKFHESEKTPQSTFAS
jgi:hypothetical protein